MGMLLSHHEGYWPDEQDDAQPKRKRGRKAPATPAPVAADQPTEGGSDTPEDNSGE